MSKPMSELWARLKFEARSVGRRYSEKTQMWLAWKLPRWLVKWAVIRAYSKAWADAGNKTPDELTYNEVMDAAGKP